MQILRECLDLGNINYVFMLIGFFDDHNHMLNKTIVK
jgi:hypothetical protein